MFKSKNNKYKDRKLTQYDKDRIMAKEILKKLGKTSRVFSYNIALAGGYYEETNFEEFGIKISSNIYEDLSIIFAGRKVFSYNIVLDNNELYNEKIYEPGDWEEIIEELYNKLPSIIHNRDRDRAYQERAKKALYLIDSIGEVKMGESIKIEEKQDRYGCDYEYYRGSHYNVYYDHVHVFSGYISYDKICKIYKYIPGDWEDELKEYRDYKLYLKEEKRKEREKNIVNNNIRKLRLYK